MRQRERYIYPMIPWTFPGMVVRREDIPGFARTFRDIFLVWSFRLSWTVDNTWNAHVRTWNDLLGTWTGRGQEVP